MLNYGNVTSFKRKLSDKEIIDVKSLTIGKSALKYFHVNCKLSYKDNIGFHSEVKKIKLHHSMANNQNYDIIKT